MSESRAGDFDTVLQAQLALRVGPEPDVVTIWVGAKDIIDGVDPVDFEEDLDDLLGDLEYTDALVTIAESRISPSYRGSARILLQRLPTNRATGTNGEAMAPGIEQRE